MQRPPHLPKTRLSKSHATTDVQNDTLTPPPLPQSDQNTPPATPPPLLPQQTTIWSWLGSSLGLSVAAGVFLIAATFTGTVLIRRLTTNDDLTANVEDATNDNTWTTEKNRTAPNSQNAAQLADASEGTLDADLAKVDSDSRKRKAILTPLAMNSATKLATGLTQRVDKATSFLAHAVRDVTAHIHRVAELGAAPDKASPNPLANSKPPANSPPLVNTSPLANFRPRTNNANAEVPEDEIDEAKIAAVLANDLQGAIADEEECKADPRSLETAIHWEESIQQAATKASEENKLVFLIHVSGNFEQTGFT